MMALQCVVCMYDMIGTAADFVIIAVADDRDRSRMTILLWMTAKPVRQRLNVVLLAHRAQSDNA